MTAYYEQPLRKLLGSLSITIGWLNEKGSVEVSAVPAEHLEPIKQLERIGVVHKRNNRMYELQKVRLKKLMDQMGMDSLPQAEAVAVPAPAIMPAVVPTAKPAVATLEVPVAVPAGDPHQLN